MIGIAFAFLQQYSASGIGFEALKRTRDPFTHYLIALESR